MPAPSVILDLVDRFQRLHRSNQEPPIPSDQLLREFLDPLFAALGWALERLSSQDAELVTTLRSFEKLLLEELGYGLDFRHDASSGEPIAEDAVYELDVLRGFVPGRRAEGIKGELLLEIAEENFESAAVRQAAKKIFRLALGELLGPKPLTSRRLLLRGVER